MEISTEEQVIKILDSLQQTHIVEEFKKRSKNEQEEFTRQINHLQKIYPGGLEEYIKRAKVFLNNSKNNVNPYSDFIPSVPEGEKINIWDKEFTEFEKIGMEQLKSTGFVLVAGGLGERLGYDDIKVGIAMDLVTGTCFLKYYIDYLRAYQDRLSTDGSVIIPLCIMTSDDTHEKTLQLLETNNYFGLKKEQITIVKQEKVPALLDNDCHFALLQDKFLIDTKPHGHGDVHTLLHQFNVIKDWKSKGKKW
jgi:UDP-sugar pyrophosphorylase